ncbi:MAG: YceI family protein [Planctomycetes bacterium]|nr:YceI family protein [Planctomycetota bacterium]
MARKLLTALGVVFVLGLVGAAIAGLAIVKDRIRVVVQADDSGTEPEPLALVRDDVQMLQRDLGVLREALPGQFERLGAALDERAELRHADVTRLADAIAATDRRVAALEQELAAARRTLAEFASRPVGAAAAEPVTEIASAAVTTPATDAPETDAPERAAPVSEPPAGDAPAEPAKTGFLSFSVPTRKFDFAARQDYELVPQLCRVGFDAKSTLHDFTGVTSTVSGKFTADFDDPEGAWSGAVECEAATLTTGLEGRDDNMREHLDTEHHGAIRFEIERFEPTAVDVGKQTASGAIDGRMTIRGKTRELRMPIEISVDASKRIVIAGQTTLKLTDFEVPVPSQLGGTITMQDEVAVWIALRARMRAGGGE